MKELLPHRAPALLIDAVESVTDDSVACLGSFPAASPLATDGTVPGHALLEMVAQAAGVLEAVRRRARGEANPAEAGFLVRARNVALSRGSVRVGEPVRLTARREGAIGQLGLFTVRAEIDGVVALTGSLSTWLP